MTKIEKFIALILLIIILPFFFVLFLLTKVTSQGPFLFKQKRLGKNKKEFEIYKIRTMVENAEVLKEKLLVRNEVEGPVFKIRDDPRYTALGKFLSHTGLDEIPQLINIVKGEMTFVGPRPLPINEALGIPKKFHKRFSILPGITSLWVVKGSHKVKFIEWMELDIEYIKNKSKLYDLFIIMNTLVIIMRQIIDKIILGIIEYINKLIIVFTDSRNKRIS